jgi:hypothetical protein
MNYDFSVTSGIYIDSNSVHNIPLNRTQVLSRPRPLLVISKPYSTISTLANISNPYEEPLYDIYILDARGLHLAMGLHLVQNSIEPCSINENQLIIYKPVSNRF